MQSSSELHFCHPHATDSVIILTATFVFPYSHCLIGTKTTCSPTRKQHKSPSSVICSVELCSALGSMRTQADQEVFIEIRDLRRQEGCGVKRTILVGFQCSGAAKRLQDHAALVPWRVSLLPGGTREMPRAPGWKGLVRSVCPS